jgi:hypothetical protein
VPLRLSVLVNNPARRLYGRLGFRVTAVDHPRVRMEWRAIGTDPEPIEGIELGESPATSG